MWMTKWLKVVWSTLGASGLDKVLYKFKPLTILNFWLVSNNSWILFTKIRRYFSYLLQRFPWMSGCCCFGSTLLSSSSQTSSMGFKSGDSAGHSGFSQGGSGRAWLYALALYLADGWTLTMSTAWRCCGRVPLTLYKQNSPRPSHLPLHVWQLVPHSVEPSFYLLNGVQSQP